MTVTGPEIHALVERRIDAVGHDPTARISQRYLHSDAQSIADAGTALSAHLTAKWSSDDPELRLIEVSKALEAQT